MTHILAGASPLWFATRAAGTVTLVLLSLTVFLGVVSAIAWRSPLWPRFLTAALHRNLTLLGLALLVVHIITAVLDPFAHLRWRDAVVPTGSAYRPFWLGLGVLAMEILLALTVTSMLRNRIGHRLWRSLHWLAYLAWPLALVHGLGTGSDARAWWSVLITIACMGTVASGVVWRLSDGWVAPARGRRVVAIAAAMSALAVVGWSVQGPLRAGWSDRAGTPVAAAATPAASAGWQDPLTGTVTQVGGANAVEFSDRRDPSIHLSVKPGDAGVLVLSITRAGTSICDAPVRLTSRMDATCGNVSVAITLTGQPPDVGGWLSTSGPIA